MAGPDPQQAREIARYPDTARGRIQAYLDHRPKGVNQRPEDECIGLTMATADTPLRVVDLEELLAKCVQLERAVSWPNEQPQRVRDGDEAAGHIQAFLDAREARGDARSGRPISIVHADGSWTGEEPGMYRRPLTDADLRAVLAGRERLAARIAELEAEHDADVRAVAHFFAARGLRGNVRSLRALAAHFAARAAELDQRAATNLGAGSSGSVEPDQRDTANSDGSGT